MTADIVDARLRSGTVRLLDVDGVTVGAGAVVSDRIVVTCAHVVEAAGGGPSTRVKIAPLSFTGEQLQPGAAPGAAAAVATVLPDSWVPIAAGDIAVLQTHEALPASFVPLQFGDHVEFGDDVRMYGFPGTGSPYEQASGTIATDVRDGAYSRRIDLDAARIRPGYSGAPVFDVDQDRVIGLVTTIYVPDFTGRGRDVTFAIPTTELARAFRGFPVTPPKRSIERFSGMLDVAGRTKLVEALLRCDSLATTEARDAVFGDLRKEILQRIKRSSVLRTDVDNAVKKSGEFPGGVKDLIEAVRRAEGDTYARAELDQVVAELGAN